MFYVLYNVVFSWIQYELFCFLVGYLSGKYYVRVTRSLSFCRSLFVLLSFFFWPLNCLSFFDLLILITNLASSSPTLGTF